MSAPAAEPSAFATPEWVVAEALAGGNAFYAMVPPSRRQFVEKAGPLVEALRNAGMLREGL